ncbi:hypothetical protein L7F22_060428 [Adiantum nelumboides]|nr:hypothetical protein [Adiantum nelumboides]
MGTKDGTVAIVTGAGSGIGAATARRFAADGATVVLTGRTKEKLDDVVAGADPAVADRMHVLVADSSDEEAITHLVDEVASGFGRLDTLVNNAAVPGRAPRSRPRPSSGGSCTPSTSTGSSSAAAPRCRTCARPGARS